MIFLLISLVHATEDDSGIYVDTGARAEKVDVDERGCGGGKLALLLMLVGLTRPRREPPR